MRRTTAALTALLMAILTLVGFSSPADAAPTPGQGCTLTTTTHMVDGVTSTVDLDFAFYGAAFITEPAWSYQVRAHGSPAIVASNSFAHSNSQMDSFATAGWKTGTYRIRAEFGETFPTCETTFQVQGEEEEGQEEDHDTAPPTATISCPSEVVAGKTINVTGTAYDDQGVTATKIRFPDGTEKPGDTGTWVAGDPGTIAFAYFARDASGNQATDLCEVAVVAAPATEPAEPSAPSAPAPSAPAPSPTPTPAATPSTPVSEPEAEDTAQADGSTVEPTEEDNDAPAEEETSEPVEGDDDESEETGETTLPADDPANDPEPEIAPFVPEVNVPADLNEPAPAITGEIPQVASAQPTDASTGINIPVWFMVLIAALAAYKPATDLWRHVAARHSAIV